jgi:hypothetical protein
MQGRVLTSLAVMALLVACGGTSTSPDLFGDGGPDAASSPDGAPHDAATDGTSSDAAAPDANEAAGKACAKAGTASKCITCCRDAFPGSGSELVFSQECDQCKGFCDGKTPCGTNVSLAADGGCVKCLSPKLGPAASGWTQCQQSASCKGFVACFATCPTT